MLDKQFRYLLILFISLLTGFLITTTFFYLSLRAGSEGVALDLFGGEQDGVFYWDQALNVANDRPWINTSIYAWIIGQVVKITTIQDVYVVRVFNYLGYILLVVFSGMLVEKVAQRDKQFTYLKEYIYDIKSIIAVFILVYPSLLMNVHSSIIRDIWIYAFYVICTYFVIKIFFVKEDIVMSTILLIPSMWLLYEFRNYIFLSFILSLIAYYFYRRVLKTPSYLKLLMWFVIAFGIYFTFFRNIRIPIVDMSLVDALNYRIVEEFESAGGSQMWINLNQSNYPMFLINYIHSYISNAIGPLPWHLSGLSTLLIFVVETIPMILILYYIFKKRDLLTNVTQFLLLHGFVWFALIAVTNDNVGTATRLRVTGWLMIFFVYVIVLFKSLSKKKEEKHHV